MRLALCLALVSVLALGLMAHKGPHKERVCLTDCDTSKRSPVCGYNGTCYAIFKSFCAMNDLNCRALKKPSFSVRLMFGDCTKHGIIICKAWKLMKEAIASHNHTVN